MKGRNSTSGSDSAGSITRRAQREELIYATVLKRRSLPFTGSGREHRITSGIGASNVVIASKVIAPAPHVMRKLRQTDTHQRRERLANAAASRILWRTLQRAI